jgi:RNA polymerase sigma-70 factor, ECF subfamily
MKLPWCARASVAFDTVGGIRLEKGLSLHAARGMPTLRRFVRSRHSANSPDRQDVIARKSFSAIDQTIITNLFFDGGVFAGHGYTRHLVMRVTGGATVMQPVALNNETSASLLVARISAGDGLAEAQLFKEYARALRHIARRHLTDVSEAEDVVQEAFRIGIERLRASALNDPAALPGFLRGIVINVCIAWKRGQWREQPTDFSDEGFADIARSDAGPLERASSDELQVIVQRLISEMTVPRDRHLLRGYYVQDQDKETLCRELGLSQEHFDRVLHRARARFRELAHKMNDFDGVHP